MLKVGNYRHCLGTLDNDPQTSKTVSSRCCLRDAKGRSGNNSGARDSLATQFAPAQRAKRNERKRDMIPEYHLRKMIEVGTVGADVEQLRAMLRVFVGEPEPRKAGIVWFSPAIVTGRLPV